MSEARARKVSKSDIVRDSAATHTTATAAPSSHDDIADLIGSVDGLPADLSSNNKHYLRAGYGRKLLVDASFLVALSIAGTPITPGRRPRLLASPRPWKTCEPALSEAFYMLGPPPPTH